LIYPEGDAIKERIHNRYSLVVLAAKRARQLKEGAPALIETTSANALTVALEEIAAGKVNYIEGVEMSHEDEMAASGTVDTAVVEESFFPATETRPTASPISEELAVFMDVPAAAQDEEETDVDEEQESNAELGALPDEAVDPSEDSEAS
jgi:DNA-directed RNA polymerase subunit omega